MIRSSAVAGQFYPADAESLAREVGSFLDADAEKRKAIAIVSPHAGYVYSGRVAGATFSSVEAPPSTLSSAPTTRAWGPRRRS